MGFFENFANGLSSAFSGASKFIEDVYHGIKDTSSFIKRGADQINSWLDQATNTVANIPYVGNTLANAIEEGRNFAFIPGIGSLNDVYNEIKLLDRNIQNNPYEGVVNQLGSLLKSGIDAFSSFAPSMDTATQGIQQIFA